MLWNMSLITYVGAFSEEIISINSGVNSSNRNARCGELCVKRMLRAAWVDILHSIIVASDGLRNHRGGMGLLHVIRFLHARTRLIMSTII